MDENTDSRTATFERKRPFDTAARYDSSHAGSADSTPRKRVKRMDQYGDKRGYQDVRDFVPNGVQFSKSGGQLAQQHGYRSENEDDEDFNDVKVEGYAESVDREEEDSTKEDDAAFTEGRRLHIGNLPGGATMDDIRKFFEGYSM